MNRINRLILTSLLTLALCSIGGSIFIASPAQAAQNQGNRNPACGCYVCDKLLIVEFGITPGDCYGILAQDACQENLRSNRTSPELRRSYCNNVKAKVGEICPQSAGICDSPNGKYCGDNMPDKGFIFGNVVGGGVYEEPSSNSPTFGTIPNGGRLVYTKTMRAPDGQTWYYAGVPGTSKMGWVPGSNVSCTRPQVRVPPRPSQSNNPSVPSLGTVSGTQVAAARG